MPTYGGEISEQQFPRCVAVESHSANSDGDETIVRNRAEGSSATRPSRVS